MNWCRIIWRYAQCQGDNNYNFGCANLCYCYSCGNFCIWSIYCRIWSGASFQPSYWRTGIWWPLYPWVHPWHETCRGISLPLVIIIWTYFTLSKIILWRISKFQIRTSTGIVFYVLYSLNRCFISYLTHVQTNPESLFALHLSILSELHKSDP